VADAGQTFVGQMLCLNMRWFYDGVVMSERKKRGCNVLMHIKAGVAIMV